MAIKIDAENEEIKRIVPVLTSLQEACRDLGVEFYVIGAFARDLHLITSTTLTSLEERETCTWLSP